MSAETLRIEGAHKRFGGIHAVRGVDLVAHPHELLGLFGPNGAGKTTLFNLVTGAYPPTSGRIELLGHDVTRTPAFRRARAGIGRTFQVVRPFRSLSVLENVLVAVPRGEGDRERARGILATVGLADRAAEEAATLTLGMLKRLEVARALALQPKLLLLDEPLAGLTAGEIADMLGAISSLREHATVILVDHNVRQAMSVCDRAIVMDAGAVIATGTPAEVRRDPAVRRAYLGEGAS